MRQQTSLEFLIIAGAISLLVLFSITQYGTEIKHYSTLPESYFANYTTGPNPTYHQKPYLEASMPPVSTQDYQNTLYVAAYGCSNGTISISLNSSSITFSTYNITENFYNVWTYLDNFTTSGGLNKARLKYSIACNGSIYNGSEYLSTEAPKYPGTGSYAAYITKRNESTIYNSQEQEVPYLYVSSHCTFEDFFYNPYPINAQCGSYDAWQYRVSLTYCSYGGVQTETICVNPQGTGYNASILNPYQSSYEYSANITIVGAHAFNSRISSANKSSPMYYSGILVGNTSVENVTSSQTSPAALLIHGENMYLINYTYASEYEQARSNLFRLLEQYNSSWVSPGISSEIQQDVSEYNYYEGQLVSATDNNTLSVCKKEGSSISCPAEYPFYYLINATLIQQYSYGNQTLSYAGSVIRVFS